jgi:multicomponent Na+:H+ antiporter subunit E
MSGPARPNREEGGTGSPFVRFVALFIILGGFWIVLSGQLGLQPAIFLILSVTIVAYFNAGRFYRSRFISPPRFLRYAVWLLYNVITSKFQVAYLVLHRGMPIQPSFLRFQTGFKRHGAQAMLANSITLTPGTITVNVQDGEYVVHALVPRSASGLVNGQFQNMVGAVFGEDPEPAPEVMWASSIRELEQ